MAATGRTRRKDDIISVLRESYDKEIGEGLALDPPILGDDIKDPWTTPCKRVQIPFFANPENGEDFLEYAKSLFYLAANMEDIGDPQTYFTIYVNIMRLMTKKQDKQFSEALAEDGYETCVGTAEDAETLFSSLVPHYAAEPEYEASEMSLNFMLTLLGIHLNFITKKLTSNNQQEWYKKRISVYTKQIGCDPNRGDVNTYLPSLDYVEAVNNMSGACFTWRRLMFLHIQTFSQQFSTYFVAPCKVTLVYFYMAELTAYSMVFEWIVVKNPGILAWNGITKFLPALKAALAAFRKMGTQAPYCKFLYRPERLRIFQPNNLGILPAVAAQISIADGNVSYKNYKGNSYVMSGEMVEKIKSLVRAFDCAQTHASRAANEEIFYEPDEKSLMYYAIRTPVDVTQSGAVLDGEPIIN